MECGICLDSKKENEMTETCCEKHKYCNECLTSYFGGLIMEGTIEAIKCPTINCKTERIHLNVIKNVVDKVTFERFERLQLERSLDSMPDIMWCPKPNCNQPVIVSLRRNHGRCASCDYCFCIRCKKDSHFGQCSRVIQSKIDQDTVDWLKSQTRQCPTCFIFIQKNGGCSHMYCTRCRTPFIWTNATQELVQPLNVDKKTHQVVRPLSKLSKITETSSTSVQKKGLFDPKLKKCPTCKAVNEKKTNSNHLKCRNCKNHFCFECGLLAKTTSHYSFENKKCKQHSPLPILNGKL